MSENGPGISAALLDQVLQPFFLLENSRHRRTRGVGLGLAVVDDISTGQGHRLELHNCPEGGLCAELTLPRAF
ncbi:MAG: ATP-binding protein [Hydrogenophaga sp.]|nr:ATP-binding protein [Hydrogenophaga sp.]